MRVFLLLLAALTFAAPAWACFLPISTPEIAQEDVRKNYSNYDYIVKVRVLSVLPAKELADPIGEVEIIESFKGNISGKKIIYDELKHTSCAYKLLIREESILVLKEKEGKFYVLAMHDQLVEKAGEDFLRNLNEEKSYFWPWLMKTFNLSP